MPSWICGRVRSSGLSSDGLCLCPVEVRWMGQDYHQGHLLEEAEEGSCRPQGMKRARAIELLMHCCFCKTRLVVRFEVGCSSLLLTVSSKAPPLPLHSWLVSWSLRLLV